MSWWFCLLHLTVEEGPGCPDESRVGPFATREAAAGSLDRMKARARQQEDLDREDR